MRRWWRGNSSSGVVETPTFGVPAVNIGSRQAGRILCGNVIGCPGEAGAIETALRTALTPAFAARARAVRSPYYGGDTSGRILAALRAALAAPWLRAPKTFYDGQVPAFDPRRPAADRCAGRPHSHKRGCFV